MESECLNDFWETSYPNPVLGSYDNPNLMQV